MVYCTKCGTKNEEGAKFCSKCGAILEGSLEERFERRAEKWGEQFGKDMEEWGQKFGKDAEECFGLPHGGAIIGLIIGAIILLVGFSWLLGLTLWRYFWPLIILVVGILIIAGALYGYTRKRLPPPPS